MSKNQPIAIRILQKAGPHIPTRIRYQIAKQLDKDPLRCWAYLAFWSMSPKTEDLAQAETEGLACRLQGHGCWCGKNKADEDTSDFLWPESPPF